MTEDLEWSDVEQAARQVFRVWTDNSCELDWARHAWSLLRRAHLTRHDSDVEVCDAQMLFLALGNLYYDFAHLAWQEDHVLPYAELADLLRLERSYLAARCTSEESSWDADDLSELLAGEPRMVARALGERSDAAHFSLVDTLLDGFNGVDGLFASLWRSRPDYHYETYGEIMSDATADKMVAYDWIASSGCENLRSNRDGFE